MTQNSIGQFIAALRKSSGMTQQEVADRLNVSNKAVSRWERDECAPDLTLIPALAELFGVTCDELLRGERSRTNDPPSKGAIKVDRQIKALIHRTLSGFRMQTAIALTGAIVGLIGMLGLSYGIYRPVIGFFVMLLFELSASAIVFLAINKARDLRTFNELFEVADGAQLEQFHKTLGAYSFAALFAILSCLLLSLPLLWTAPDYAGSVLTPESYFRIFFPRIVIILLLVFLKCRPQYMRLFSGKQSPRESKEIICARQRRHLTLIQLTLTLLSGLLFLLAPYFETDEIGSSTPGYLIANISGIALMAASLAIFVIFLLRQKERSGKLILTGIRNLLLLPAPLIAVNAHCSYWAWVDTAGSDSFIREDLWRTEFLGYAVFFCLLVFIVFSLIEILIDRRKAKNQR